MPEIPALHKLILSAVDAFGAPNDYAKVYEAIPTIPPQTVRSVALKYGRGLGEPRKHPRPEPASVEVVNLQDGRPVDDLGHEGEFIINPTLAPERADFGQGGVVSGGIPDGMKRSVSAWPDPGEADCDLLSGVLGEKEVPASERPFYAAMAETTRLLAERLGHLSPRWPEPPLPPPEAQYGAVFGLADIHLGKLAWARETGHDYDLAIGRRIFRNGVIDLCERVHPFGVEEIVAPIGNDFFHFDNLGRGTTKGTLVDSDGRYAKVFHEGYEECCAAVELMRSTGADVRVIHVPGNHDRLSSWHLCRELWLTYRTASGIEVDMEPAVRKYHEYGRNLFGFDHGEKVMERELPSLMAMECRERLAGKTCLEWFLGHHHRSKRTRLLPEEDTFLGCSVNWIPSLCGADSFLFEQGYIKGGRAARAYLYDRDGGREAYFEVRARES